MTLCHLLRPKAFAAIHGSYAHQLSNQLNAVSSIKNSFIPQDGSVISILENGEALLENQELPISIKYIDSESKIVIEPQLLRERLKIGELGAAFVTGIIDTQRGGWHEEPTIYLKGLPLPEGFNEETLAGEAKAAITQEIAFFLRSGACSMESLNEACRLALRRFLSSLLVKKPVVVAHIYVL